MNKIKEKITGHSSSSSGDTSKLTKNEYDSYGSNTSGTTSSATSKLQNPISSSGGTTGSSYPQNTSGMTSTAGGYSSHNQPSNYPQDTSAYTSTSRDRMPGSYGTDESHMPTSGNTPSTARQPFDPYSSKGQETAARAGTTGYGSSQTQNYSRPTAEDSSISRARDGGVTNQYSDQRYAAPQTSSHLPTSTGQTSSSHHGRDAALAGGAGAVGAGGIGAYELNKNQSSSQPLTSGQHQDVSYMNRDTQPMGSMGHDSSMAGGPTSGTLTGSSMGTEHAGLTQARKMGGA